MATTHTGEEILQTLLGYAGIGSVLLNADIDALAAGSITSVKWLRNGNWPSNHFQSLESIVYRPGNATGVADYIRYATTVTSAGVLSVDANWSDTTLGSENAYVIKYGIHPQWIIDALNRALRICYFPNLEPLSAKPSGTTVADAGFQKTATTSYVESDADGGAATTFSKITTDDSENVFRGVGAGRILNAAAGGYIRQRFAVTEQEQVIFHTLSRLNSGTNVQNVLQDVTNSAAIGTTVSHSQAAWQWSHRNELIPSGCTSLEARLGGEGTTDDIYANAFAVLFPVRSRVILDTTWQTEYEVPSLAVVRFRQAGPSNGVYPAEAIDLEEIPRSDYDFDFEKPGMNPSAIQFHNDSQVYWFQWPIYIQGRRAYSDLTTFTMALTETTACDLDLIATAAWVQLLADPRVREKVPNAQQKYGEANFAFQQYRQTKRAEAPAQKKLLTVHGVRN